MQFIKKNLSRLFYATFLIIVPVVSFAQVTPCNPGLEICNPINSSTVDQVITKFLEGALRIGLPVVSLAVIYCGFLFVQARGNSEKLTKAKDSLFYTMIGAAVLLGSWGIAKIISETVRAL